MKEKQYRSLLILRSGQTHDDIDFISHEIEMQGVKVQKFDVEPLFNHQLSFESFVEKFNWDEIGLIDVRYCRGLPRRWESGYKTIFTKLDRFLSLQKEQGRHIRTIPSFRALNWVLNKAGYLADLRSHDLPMARTELIPDINERQASEFVVSHYMNQTDLEHIVIKPSVGSGSDGMEFISRVKAGKYKYLVEQYQRDKSDSGLKNTFGLENDDALNQHFRAYRFRYKMPIILQEFIRITGEISAVYIDGIPHFIERTLGQNTKIAHEKFGGENILIHHPPDSWRTLADKIYKLIPAAIRKRNSIRIDMFECEDRGLLFSEIEGASHRLFFEEFLAFYKEHYEDEKQEIKADKPLKYSSSNRYIKMLIGYLHENPQFPLFRRL